MMKKISIKNLSLGIHILLAIVILLMSAIAMRMYYSEIMLFKKQKHQSDIIMLISKQRERSRLLKENARAFVACRKPKFEINYKRELDIRKGLYPRKNGRTVSDRMLLEEIGMLQKEKQILNEIDLEQKVLSFLELTAMNARKGLYNDGYGNFKKQGKANQRLALNMLYSEEYLDNVKNIEAKSRNLFETINKRIEENIIYYKSKRKQQGIALDILITVMILLLIFNYVTVRKKIILPIKKLKKKSELISKGDLNIRIKTQDGDEIEELWKAIKELVEGVKLKSCFIQAISKGDLSQHFEPLGIKDEMGKALIELQSALKAAKEEEIKRTEETTIRRWTTEGLAMFGEILRKDNDDLHKLSNNINVAIVKYMKANQGGLFIINDQDLEDKHLEMVSCFAYDRKRKVKNRLELTEGLLGRCVDESETIYMTDIPESYINITSGLGEKTPNYLLIVPLKLNEEVFGVIEIASFDKIEKYKVEFVEKIGESIASTLHSAKINAQTAELLSLTQENAEELAAQEEEMRQNLEELETTQDALDAKDKHQQKLIEQLNKENEEKFTAMISVQEEMASKEAQISGLLSAVNSSTLVAEFDLEGNYINVNDNYINALGITQSEIIKKNHRNFAIEAAKDIDSYNKLWENLRKGIIQKNIVFLKSKNEIWLSETYTPIKNTDGEVIKIFNINGNITKIKEQEFEMKTLLNNLEDKAQEQQAQEEELRQNLEEMQATQEALAEKDEKQKKEIEKLKLEHKKQMENLELVKTNDKKQIDIVKKKQQDILQQIKEKTEKKEAELLKIIEEKEMKIKKISKK